MMAMGMVVGGRLRVSGSRSSIVRPPCLAFDLLRAVVVAAETGADSKGRVS